MAQQIQGLNIMVYAEVNGVLKAIGGQKNCTLSMEADTIDVSNKNDFGWSSFIAGAKSWTVSCDGQFLAEVTKGEGDNPDTYAQDADQSALMKAFLDSEIVKIEMKDSKDGIYYAGEAVITSLELEAAFDDVFAYSVEFQGKGPLTTTKQA